MIDIHCHILPGLDDGPGTMEECVAMARMAAEAGTTDIVASPHSNLEFSFQPSLVNQKIGEVAAACGGAVRLHRGCDFHLHYDNVQDALANPSRYSINGKCYILVEFSDLLIARTSEDVLHRLRVAGLIPIVTHPERNPLLMRRFDRLESWVRDGCCLQVTAQSLLGGFGKQARESGEAMLRRGLVHFVASDAHDSRHRTPRLDEAYRHVAAKYGESVAERLFVVNPGAVLAGEPLEDGGEPDEAPAARRWYKFWR